MSNVFISKVELPFSPYVEPEKIAKMLDNNSASYKYYWFWAIINKCVKNSNDFIFDIRDLCVDMLYLSYWTVNECHLFLGYKDILEITNKEIYEKYNISSTIKEKDEFINILHEKGIYEDIQKKVYDKVKQNVIFRLLSPFVDKNLIKDKDIKKESINYLANELKIKMPYKFIDNYSKIEINEDYVIYFVKHYDILIDFIKYKLVEYLQKINSSIPGIVNKIEPLYSRETLDKQRKMYKFIYEISDVKSINNDIYTGKNIRENILSKEFQLDHFIPYSFCSHNEWWNLTPTTIEVNGANNKSNKIPSKELIEDLAKQQYAISFIIKTNDLLYKKFFPNNNINKFIKDSKMFYIYFDRKVKKEFFVETFNEIFNPMIDLALRQGFLKWEFTLKK